MSLSLGIDIGTSGVRTAVIDEDGAVLSMARAAHVSQRPDAIDARGWWDATRQCVLVQVDALRAAERDGTDISRVSIDGTSGTMVLVDQNLTPVTRALMYNSKGFTEEAEQIAARAPDVHITRGSNSALARAMRLVSEDQGGAAQHLLHQADFIAATMLGSAGASDHNNALKTGFDPEHGSWPNWIGHVIDPGLLPAPVPIGTPLGAVTKEVADALGLSADCVVCAGTTDSIAAFLAVAPLTVGLAVTSLGSTLAVKAVSASRIDAPEIGLYSHRLGDVWLAGGASNTGGAVLAHFFEADALTMLSQQIDPERPTGLDFYPLLTPGERFPINDPDLEPRLTPRPDDDARFLQAIFEGIAAIEAECYRALVARGGVFPDAIYSAGGGATNAVFTRIRAKALGFTPQQASQTEAAIGSARVAAGLIFEKSSA